MKKLSFVSKLALVLVMLISLFSCYQVPKMDENMSFLISGESKVNGYWGRSMGLTNKIGFVGDSMIDAKKIEAGKVHLISEGGCVSLLQINDKGVWEIMRYPQNFANKELAGKPVTFTSPKVDKADQFGAEIYFEPDSECVDNGSQNSGWLFVSSLMADVPGVNSNTGVVDLFRVEEGITPQSVFDGSNPKFVSRISLEGQNFESFLPKADGVDKSTEIRKDKINPGIGFGAKMAYDGKSKVLAVAAPYESYSKDLKNNGIDVLMSKVGAVYVFEPEVGSETSLDKWVLKARLMPQANLPQYKVTEVFDKDGNSLGRVAKMVDNVDPTLAKETNDSTKQAYKTSYVDRPNYHFGNAMDVAIDNAGNVNIVVGVYDAVFQFHHPKEKGETAAKYFNEKKEDITEYVKKNDNYFFRFEEHNPKNGALFLFQKKAGGDGSWEFKQQMVRSHYKHDFYHKVGPGSYIIDDLIDKTKAGIESQERLRKGFFGWKHYFEQQLGTTVALYGDAVITGIPQMDVYSGTGYEPDTSIGRLWNDLGGLVTFSIAEADINKPFQINDPKFVHEYYWEKWGDKSSVHNDWPCFGKYMKMKGNVLAVGAPGSDYGIYQQNVGRILFFELPPKASASAKAVNDQIKYIDNSMVTAKELYKGWQELGRFFDFTMGGQVFSGNPDFDMGIYYNNPYVQYYVMDNCGALYTFKWK